MVGAVFFCSTLFALADPEINLKGTIISDAMLQEIGCISNEGVSIHTACNLSSVTDLTKPFHTPERWTLVQTQGPADDSSDGGGIELCFLKRHEPSCQAALIPTGVALTENSPSFSPPAGGPYNQPGNVTFVQPAKPSLGPLLEFTPYEFNGGPGAPFGLMIFAYNRKTDSFSLIFSGTSHGNVNAETRLIASGPLAGDVAADYPTSRWPYSYEITLYRLTAAENYIKVLDYKGKSKWDDGNSLAVIDAEMPEIEKRLDLWSDNQPLPRPPTVPAGCKLLEMRNGLEWCD